MKHINSKFIHIAIGSTDDCKDKIDLQNKFIALAKDNVEKSKSKSVKSEDKCAQGLCVGTKKKNKVNNVDISKVKLELRRAKESVKELKNIRYCQTKEIKELNQAHLAKDVKIAKLESRIEELTVEVNGLSEKNQEILDKNSKLLSEVKRRNSVVKNHDDMFSKYQHYKSLFEIREMELIDVTQKLKGINKKLDWQTKRVCKEYSQVLNLENANKGLESENKKYIKSLNESRAYAKELESFIKRNFSKKNIETFDKETNEVEEFGSMNDNDRSYDNIDENKVEAIEKVVDNDDIDTGNDSYMGTVTVSDMNGYEFQSICGKTFSMHSDDTLSDLCHKKIPCEAYIKEGVARIHKAFELRYHINKKMPSKIKRGKDIEVEKSSTSENSRIRFNNESVLIIGSENEKKYVEYLRSHNLEVNWFNPFEEHLNKLDIECMKNDFVVLLTSNCSHGARWKLESLDDYYENHNKYHFIHNDGKENLIYRINYALANNTSKGNSDLTTG